MIIPSHSVLQNVHISSDVGLWYQEQFALRRGVAGEVFGSYMELALGKRGFELHTRAGAPQDHWSWGKWLFLNEYGARESQPRRGDVERFALVIGDDDHKRLREIVGEDRLITITRTDSEPLLVFIPRSKYKPPQAISVAWGIDLQR